MWCSLLFSNRPVESLKQCQSVSFLGVYLVLCFWWSGGGGAHVAPGLLPLCVIGVVVSPSPVLFSGAIWTVWRLTVRTSDVTDSPTTAFWNTVHAASFLLFLLLHNGVRFWSWLFTRITTIGEKPFKCLLQWLIVSVRTKQEKRHETFLFTEKQIIVSTELRM